jgi:hypothetical protein
LLILSLSELDSLWLESWVANRIDAVGNDQFAQTGWAELEIAFINHFSSPHAVERALIELESLRVGTGINAVRDYITRFNDLLPKCHLERNSESALFRFRKGLTDDLNKALTIHEGSKKITILDSLQDFVKSQENATLQFAKSSSGNNKSTNNNTTSTATSKQSEKTSKFNKTSNSRFCHIHGANTHATDQCLVYQDRVALGNKSEFIYEANKCAICDKKGHIAADCYHNSRNKNKPRPSGSTNQNSDKKPNEKRVYASTSSNSGNNNNSGPQVKSVATKSASAPVAPTTDKK